MSQQRILEPAAVRLAKERPGWLLLTLEDSSEPVRVQPARNFPLTDPDHYISLLGEDDLDMGLILDPKQLEPKSRRVLRRLLDHIYFLPVILKIKEITEEFGVMKWEVETSKGPRTFEVRGRDDVRLVTQGHVLVRDIDGNRYHIPSLGKMDPASKLLLEATL